jgi:hypothetical protein
MAPHRKHAKGANELKMAAKVARESGGELPGQKPDGASFPMGLHCFRSNDIRCT